MPSGSHSGSSGSHSSGGSSFGGGGSSRGGSFGGGGSSGPRRPMVFVFGHRRYVVTGNAQSIISALSILMIWVVIFIVGGSFIIKDANDDLRKIETDYNYYQEMISYAEANNDYLVQGKITDKFYNSDCDRWYLTYELKTYNNSTLKGYTYSVYTFEEISKFRIGDTIDIAVNSIPITLDTDSITMDYKDIPLDADGEYITTLSGRRTGIIMIVISSIVGVVFIGIIIRQIAKGKQQEQQPISSPTTNTSETKNSRCPYCGAIIPENKTSCPSCGAKK